MHVHLCALSLFKRENRINCFLIMFHFGCTIQDRGPLEYRLRFQDPPGCAPSECNIFVGIDTNSNTDFLDVYIEGGAQGWVAVGFSDSRDMVRTKLHLVVTPHKYTALLCMGILNFIMAAVSTSSSSCLFAQRMDRASCWNINRLLHHIPVTHRRQNQEGTRGTCPPPFLWT